MKTGAANPAKEETTMAVGQGPCDTEGEVSGTLRRRWRLTPHPQGQMATYNWEMAVFGLECPLKGFFFKAKKAAQGFKGVLVYLETS